MSHHNSYRLGVLVPLASLDPANPPTPTNINTVEGQKAWLRHEIEYILDDDSVGEVRVTYLKDGHSEIKQARVLLTDDIIRLVDGYVSRLLDTVSKRVIGEYDRDYSQDNTDERSKLILVMTSKACNDLRKEQHNTLNAIRKELEEG